MVHVSQLLRCVGGSSLVIFGGRLFSNVRRKNTHPQGLAMYYGIATLGGGFLFATATSVYVARFLQYGGKKFQDRFKNCLVRLDSILYGEYSCPIKLAPQNIQSSSVR